MNQQQSESKEKNELISLLICVVVSIGILISWGWLNTDHEQFLRQLDEYIWWLASASFILSLAFIHFRHPKHIGLSLLFAFLASALTAILGVAWLWFFVFFIVGLG